MPSLHSRERGLKFPRICASSIWNAVAPLAGAWIEIADGEQWKGVYPSLHSRERGLKSRSRKFSTTLKAVAPLAGAWIEIDKIIKIAVGGSVAPLAGAWIEIHQINRLSRTQSSLHSRERGLKYKLSGKRRNPWRRSTRGSVD